MVAQLYDLTYHMAQGVSVSVTGVSKADVEKAIKSLEDPNKVITVSSKNTTKVQAIPVRSILVCNIEEQKVA